jgi:hypothetical protein
MFALTGEIGMSDPGVKILVTKYAPKNAGDIPSFEFTASCEGLRARVTVTPSTTRPDSERDSAFHNDLFRLGTALLLAAQNPQSITWPEQDKA